MESLPSSNDKKNRISELRTAIKRAEKRNDNDEVIILEAELKAIEQDQKFNKDEFLLAMARDRSRSKRHVLRDMHDLAGFIPRSDKWNWDGMTQMEYIYSYERTFEPILSQLGIKNFQELANKKALELKKNIQVLDLFGGAYFLSDLRHVSRIIGVRLKNIDELLLDNMESDFKENKSESVFEKTQIILSNLINNPKRIIIEGDLYKRKTWTKLKKDNAEHGGDGFDVVICRPEGPFRNSNVPNIENVKDEGIAREEIFAALLQRGLDILSKDGGILFTQIPNLRTNNEILNIFWKRYVLEKQKEGYEFFFGAGESTPKAGVFAVKKNLGVNLKNTLSTAK